MSFAGERDRRQMRDRASEGAEFKRWPTGEFLQNFRSRFVRKWRIGHVIVSGFLLLIKSMSSYSWNLLYNLISE